MGLIKVWTSNYPGAVDTTSPGSFETLTNAVDDVIASHPTALSDATIVLEQENTGYKDNNIITGSTGAFEDQLDVETLIGGAMFNGAQLANLIPHLRLIGIYNLNGGASQGDLRVRMYDMGPPGTPLLPPVLRATVSIPDSDDGNIARAETVLTLSASPGVNLNQINNSLRSYEFRVVLDGAPAGATALVHWAGVALGVTQ